MARVRYAVIGGKVVEVPIPQAEVEQEEARLERLLAPAVRTDWAVEVDPSRDSAAIRTGQYV